jgi:hypothetical protein
MLVRSTATILLLAAACGGSSPPPQAETPATVTVAKEAPTEATKLEPESTPRSGMPAEVREAFVKRGLTKAHVVFRLCITTTGVVSSVSILDEGPVPDAARYAASEVKRSWRYTPYLRDGVAYPACTTMSMDIVPDGAKL